MIGYPLEDAKAGGQRVRLKFDKLFHRDEFGNPYVPDPAVDAMLREKGMIQEQAPLDGRIEEIDALADRFGRDPGVRLVARPEIEPPHERRRLGLRPAHPRAGPEILDEGGLPDYPEEMRETFTKLMEEHGLDTSKYLS